MTTFTTRPVIAGAFGVVALTPWLATSVGKSVRETGGSQRSARVQI